MADVPNLGPREVLHTNPYHEVYRRVADFGTFTKEYFVTHYGPRTGLVVVRDDAILLVRQYRLLIDELSWEIPGGKVDEGETPEAAAIRECHEETGLKCTDLKPLHSYHAGIDVLYNPCSIFTTETFEEDAKAKPSQEVTECHWVPLTECVDMVFNGKINDSFSTVAVLSYQQRRGER